MGRGPNSSRGGQLRLPRIRVTAPGHQQIVESEEDQSGIERHTEGKTNAKKPALKAGFEEFWGDRWGSNPRQPESQSGTLPTELRSPLFQSQSPIRPCGASERTRI